MSLIVSRKFVSADSSNKEVVLNALKAEITAWEKTALVSKQGENMQDKYFREPVTSSTLLSHQEKSSMSYLFSNNHAKARIAVLSLTYGQEQILREQVNCILCVWKVLSSPMIVLRNINVSNILNNIMLPFAIRRKTVIVVLVALL